MPSRISVLGDGQVTLTRSVFLVAVALAVARSVAVVGAAAAADAEAGLADLALALVEEEMVGPARQVPTPASLERNPDPGAGQTAAAIHPAPAVVPLVEPEDPPTRPL